MSWDRNLFGELVPSPHLLRKKAAGAATPARQMDLLEGFCLTISGAGAVAPSIQVPAWIEEACKAMNPNTNDLPNTGKAWAAALRKRFPDKTAKQIGAALGHDWRTVQAWLAGQAPYLDTLAMVAWKLRDPLLVFEVTGMAPPTAVVDAAELEAMRADLDALAARIERLKGVR